MCEESLAQSDSVEDETAFPHDLLLLRDTFHPFLPAHLRACVQRKLVVFPPQMDERDRESVLGT